MRSRHGRAARIGTSRWRGTAVTSPALRRVHAPATVSSGLVVSATKTAEIDVAESYRKIRAEGVRLAGGPGDIPQRVALLHSIYVDSGGNHTFPEVALH